MRKDLLPTILPEDPLHELHGLHVQVRRVGLHPAGAGRRYFHDGRSAVEPERRAAEIGDKLGAELLAAFLRKHPHLESFARSPSTALCGVEIETYFLVTRFQHVVEMRVSKWSSSTH